MKYLTCVNGDLLSEFLEEFHEEEIRCRTGLVIGIREAEGIKKILDIVLTPDPEIEIEEVEKNKKMGKAEEDDIFRDLTLFEILGSTTDEVAYKMWFTQHLERILSMLPAGIRILGIYTYCQTHKELISGSEMIDKIFTKLIKEFELPFGGKDLFLLSQTEESKAATVHSLDHNLTLNLKAKGKSDSDENNEGRLEILHDIESIYTNIFEADIITNHQIAYYIPSKMSKLNAKDFKQINQNVFNQLKTQLNSGVFQIAKKHLLKASDETKPFKEILKTHHFKAVNEVHKIDVEAFLPKLHSVIHPEFNGPSTNGTQVSLNFSGGIHSKIYIHLDWTMHEFTKFLTEDIHKSLMTRIELMSEEARNSECNIDPCLMTEENIPRLTDIHLIYPQRVYGRHTTAEHSHGPRELIAYSDHVLIWEEGNSFGI